VIVGGESGGTSVGVAPQASWIAAKIFNDSNLATTSAIHQAFQWLLDPDGNALTDDAPDIVNNSWSQGSGPGCSLEFQPDLQALVAAGIIPVFAAGNYGPGAGSAPSPANLPEAFAVGAIDNSGVIASTSSRGPSSCAVASPATYPAVVAPGVNINTTDLYGMYYSVSGTSFAAPHAAGGLALLLSAFPGLSVEQQRAALTTSALDLGAAGADNTFGAGRIDLWSAYQALSGGSTPTATPTPTSVPTATPTPTSTPTATPTPTSTPTATPTPTSVPTATPTPTSTPTATSLPTSTPTATSLPTSTPTRTPTSAAIPTPTRTATPTPMPADQIFSDGFESGSLSAWSASTTGGGRLSVTAGAALIGQRGMQAAINATSPIYVTDRWPNAETSYHARFYVSPNSAALVSNKNYDILVARSVSGTTVMRLQLRRSGGTYQVRGLIRTGSGTEQTTSWYPISNAAHAIEVAWQASSTSSASDGSLSLWIDGALKQTRSGVATGTGRIDEVRLGPSAGIASGSSGALLFDAFASSRTALIGP
jgi:outer membrane biosynthesis protein TonB